ncbi:ABC transporter ATP-binding protein [Micrococcus endophyticus]
MTASAPVLTLDRVQVGYRHPDGGTRVLIESLDLTLAPGEVVGLWGRSGTGKSSLIRHLAGLSRPVAGRIAYRSPDGSLNGEVADLSAGDLARYRREHLGYVDQSCELIGELSTLDNAAVWIHGGRIAGSACDAQETVQGLLERLGLGHRLGAPASRLSGGEAQRVALVRALSKRPHLIVADEPTGHLDGVTAREAIALLREHAEAGAAVLVASHDPLVHAAVDRAVRVGED